MITSGHVVLSGSMQYIGAPGTPEVGQLQPALPIVNGVAHKYSRAHQRSTLESIDVLVGKFVWRFSKKILQQCRNKYDKSIV